MDKDSIKTERQLTGESALVQQAITIYGCEYFPTEYCDEFVAEVDLSDLENFYLDPNLKNAVYCRAVRVQTAAGDNELWYKFKEYYNSPRVLNNVQEAALVRKVLGCTDNEELLNEYLELSLDEDFIRTQDAFYIFAYVGRQAGSGSKLAFQFLKENFSRIKERLSVIT